MRVAQIICTKVRDGAKRIVRLKEGEPEGRHVVIVDDLVQSGSTLIECQVRALPPPTAVPAWGTPAPDAFVEGFVLPALLCGICRGALPPRWFVVARGFPPACPPGSPSRGTAVSVVTRAVLLCARRRCWGPWAPRG